MTLASRKPSKAAPKRLQALAKLPVFFDLEGKRAVVAGGTAAAAWKAELLAAAGAHVEVYADELEAEMVELLARGAAAGRLRHCRRSRDGISFAGAAMALADVETEAEAGAFYNSATAAGVPVNVIDKPAYCRFQFGSIVNRSPVVIGISTDGAAPILGQSIRRRIETLLPPALASWARLAKDLRASVMERLRGGAERRAFWEGFSELAFGHEPDADTPAVMQQLMTDSEQDSDAGTPTGRVTLVGAGPGDAELLTLKAVRALQSADVILFDDLVSDSVLELARREAKRMLVGKRGHRASCRQEDINDLMVKLARLGKHVVRLKSGDPMVFGRAGEEIERLFGEGIDVAVVPGITAASAFSACFNASLTHRAHTHSVRFVTGHSKEGQLDQDLDWSGLADEQTTLMFYMSGRTAPAIAERLIAEGMSTQTPAAIAIAVSRPEMQVEMTNLGSVMRWHAPRTSSGPVLLAVGRFLEAAVAGQPSDTGWPAARVETQRTLTETA